ncbi:helix-turn-helix domain-containing protein [Glaciibacter psychrotolerans]|uniref:helix-turn-helix domain-containing protein n=1 Tax=Glaciibacter psychrotolerans TaxID=670054 RepID=UPI0015CE5C64|nr:helix-turn-helix transcriptional regulator [Leifsonia psychrotolerans]
MTMMMTAIVPTFTLADRLRKAREITGLDQGEFAERAGFSRTTVVNYEHGHRAPRTLYIRAWAEAAGVDLEWLETGKAPSEDEAFATVRPEGFEPPTF